MIACYLSLRRKLAVLERLLLCMQLAIGHRSCFRGGDLALEEFGLEEESEIEIDFDTAV